MPTRRELLIGYAPAVVAAASGCAPSRNAVDPRPRSVPTTPLAPPNRRPDRVNLVRQRATFGEDGSPFPTQMDGVRSWLQEQCRAPQENPGPFALFNGTETWGLRWRLNSIEALRTGTPLAGSGRQNGGFELRDVSQPEMLRQLAKAALLRATYSRWQLRERMVVFWTDHFNIYARKVAVARERRQTDAELMYLIPADQNQVIRPHALGTLRNLVAASMRSPAMLGYLDNHVSRKGNPNENYARELMELHTLGVHGGYAQRDVREVARCLTGWTIEDRFLQRTGSVRFDPQLHDNGEKIVLGKRIPAGGGPDDANQVLDILCSHPATARHIAGKLVDAFHGPSMDQPRLTKAVEQALTASSGNIPHALVALFTHPLFASAPPRIRRPFDYLVACLRATGAISDCDQGVQRHLDAMGQPPHQWPMPDGYSVDSMDWEANLLPRWNFAEALAFDRIQGTRLEPISSLERLCSWPTDRALGPRDRIADILSSPDFLWT